MPKLVVPVLTGTDTLRLFADEVELIGFVLDIKVNKKEFREYPAYRFFADDTIIVLVVFPEISMHHPPLSTIDDRSMRRMSVNKVEKLISTSLN